MKLYEEILFLKHNAKCNWVVENVKPYYGELVPATQLGRHLFWSNFEIPDGHIAPKFKDMMKSDTVDGSERMKDWLGIRYQGNIYANGNHSPTQVLRNCVHPETGFFVFEAGK